MEKILFIDRDGTIIEEPPIDFQVDNLEKLLFVPGVIGALQRIKRESDYRLVMVSNQDGLGSDSFPMESFLKPHLRMLQTLEGEKIYFDEVLIDESFPEECSIMRKPAIGMVEKYMNELLDKQNSYVIGDRWSDMQLAKNMGIKGIFFRGDKEEKGIEILNDWEQIADSIIKGSRRASCCRETSETSVVVEIDLNGIGETKIETGLSFFDHMLCQIARHSGIEVRVVTKGDLQVDEHHTIEDTALALGYCIDKALGIKRGIGRYGFVLPMDEAKASVTLDLGGRSWLEWSVSLNREYVGDFPTEMTRHFFASFCQEARCNLHIEATGENTHHVIEAIFKGFGRALKMAIKQEGTQIPSSKGVL